MTDNEIIKALECYTKENEFEYFHSNTMNEYPLIRKALDLINRQKAEIEALIAGQETLQKYRDEEINRLEIELKAMRGAANSYKAEIESITEKFNCQQTVYGDLSKIIKEQAAEITRLEETKNRLSYNLQAVLDERADHSEAVKEFAERLKEKAVDVGICDAQGNGYGGATVILIGDIDNLKKEMVGEG